MTHTTSIMLAGAVVPPEDASPTGIYLLAGFGGPRAGRTWLSLGGAITLARKHRIAGEPWRPQEQIVEHATAVAMSGGFVDVILTHDCLAGVRVPDLIDGWDAIELLEAHAHQQRLAQVVHAVNHYRA